MSLNGVNIPMRRADPNAALPFDYCTTPGGTIFSTTPGGTRIIYERGFLLQMRNSPVAKTPPKNLPQIPGVTCGSNKSPSPTKNTKPREPSMPVVNESIVPKEGGDEPQFEMDI